jgi:hypothetical protein
LPWEADTLPLSQSRRAAKPYRIGSADQARSAVSEHFREHFAQDLEASLADGVPRKLLVFSHLKADVIQPIQEAREQELRAAHRELAQTPTWKAARAKARAALDAVLEAIEPYIRARKRAGGKIARRLAAFRRAIEGSVFFDLLGKRAFSNRVTKELLDLVGAEEQAARTESSDEDDEVDDDAWYAHQIRTKQRDAMAVLDAIARAPALRNRSLVATFLCAVIVTLCCNVHALAIGPGCGE